MRDQSSIPTKVCTKCGVELPATPEFFGPHAHGRYGLHPRCRKCRAEDARLYRQAHPEISREYARRYRREHPEVRAAYYESRREALAEYDHHRYQNNREAKLAHNRRYHQENREAVARRNRLHRQYNHQAILERDRLRYESDPDRFRSYSRNRHARKRNAPGSHTAADIAAQRTRQKGRCYWCGEKVGRHYHVDHVVPLALGGSNGPENLVIACAHCNLSKGATHPMDFAGRLL
jgi:5-methylcytosine-specific restriction endonuclease McrA